MVIGCCDSRVSPEVIFDAGPGELFVRATSPIWCRSMHPTAARMAFRRRSNTPFACCT